MPKKIRLTKRQMQAEGTRLKITESARRLILDEGYDNVTIEEIAEHAGTSKGTFYTYFKSKQDILFQEYLQADQLYESLYHSFMPEQTTSSKLYALVKAGFDFCSEKGIEMTRIVYSAQVGGSESRSFASFNLYKMVTAILEEGIQKGEVVTELSLEALVRYFGITHRSMIFEWCLMGGSFDLTAESMEYMKHMFFIPFCHTGDIQPL